MQDYQVTVNGVRFDLERPLFVLATQNPIEQEGTYPLPEAQLDRFMFNVVIEYPSADEERRILALTTGTADPVVSVVASGAEIEQLHALVREVPAAENVIDFAARIVRATRPAGPAADLAPEFVRKWVRWGAGPRAGQALLLGAKARALLEGRSVAAPDDVIAVALPGAASSDPAELSGGSRRHRHGPDRHAPAGIRARVVTVSKPLAASGLAGLWRF